jgi:hypothetical protein
VNIGAALDQVKQGTAPIGKVAFVATKITVTNLEDQIEIEMNEIAYLD